MEKISDRLSKLIQNEGISARSLEQKIGCSNGVLSKSILKGTDINAIWLSKIIETLPNYSALWIMTGNGDMLIESNQASNIADEPFCKYTPSPPPCKECKLKDIIIANQEREIASQAEFIKYLQDNLSSDTVGQKRKESSSTYGDNELSEAV